MRFSRKPIVLLLSRYPHHTLPIYRELSLGARVIWVGLRIPKRVSTLNLIPIFLYELLGSLLLGLKYRPRVILSYYLGLESLVSIILKYPLRAKAVLYSIGSDMLAAASFQRAIASFSLRRSDALICVNKELGEIGRKLGARSVKVIPTLINTHDFHLTAPRSKEFDVINVGYLVPVKGQGLLIDACKELPGISVVIVGEGPLMKELTLKAKHSPCKITFTGKVVHRKVWELLQMSKIYVHTSTREGVPAAILEAMYCELPVIAVKASYLTFLKDLGLNIIVAERDPRKLAETIKTVLSNYQRESTLARENKKKLVKIIEKAKKDLVKAILY